MQEALMDILRGLSTGNADVRERILDLCGDLVTPKNIEPFIMLSALNPSTDVEEDGLVEVTGGVNVYLFKDLRLTLDYVNRRTNGRNRITNGSHTLTLQLGE
jgi:hypothetical protein